jgi:oxygen-independent coproporphyrinogen-3 oxidase
MYYTLIDRLESAGFEHYEISNFARPGFRSRHNSSYWTGIPYLGLGAAAHSFDGHTRSWNVADIHQYIEGIEQGQRIFDSETIEGDTRYNDLLTTALRTREGLDLRLLSKHHRDYCLRSAHRFIDDGLLTNTDEHLALTRRGLFVSDMVISGLMLVDD